MIDKTFKDILDFSSQYDALVRYDESTDFATVARGAAQNEVWRDTTSETLWNILSRCGKDINNIVSSSAIDYVQNLCDINTARIPSLVSMARMLKYETGSLEDLYNTFPANLQLMIDLFSVDREYLFATDSHILAMEPVRKLMERLKVGLLRLSGRTYSEEAALKDVFSEIRKNNHRVNEEQYRSLVKLCFYEFIITVLTATYSPTDTTSLVDNLLFEELSQYPRYDSVPRDTIIDRMISGESRHPLDMEFTSGSSIVLDGNIKSGQAQDSLAGQVTSICREYGIALSFNPWMVADEINAHGLSPLNDLTENEKAVVEIILNAHNKERFDYANGHYLLGKIDTRYGYYREREFVNYLKAFSVLHSLNVQTVTLSATTVNLVSIDKKNTNDVHALDFFNYVEKDWEYDEDSMTTEKTVDEYGIGAPIIPKPTGTDFRSKPSFVPRLGSYADLLRDKIGYEYDTSYGTMNRGIELDNTKQTDIIERIADTLTDLVFKIHFIRNELKRQAQFNAMRGTGSLLAHAINDFLLVKYPTQKFTVIPRWSDRSAYAKQIEECAGDVIALGKLNKKIEENIELFRNYTNVDIIEYMDTTEYFNIHPSGKYTADEQLLSTRYWEKLSRSITDRSKPQLGVFSADEIHDFYRNTMSMGSLHSSAQVKDDVEEFLISLYESGATDTEYNEDTGLLEHRINDVSNEDNLFAYTLKSDRMKVQNNRDLVDKQDKQFLRYSSNTSLNGEMRSRNGSGQVIESFNWKNKQYASVMLHPFMYTFQLWNPLVNIIINAMSEYITEDLENSLTNKKVFDELYGVYGESKDFWKYNILDFTGYMTRYEHEKHSATNAAGLTSPLTGYDGSFYPSAVHEFIVAYNRSKAESNRDKTFVPRVGNKKKSIFIESVKKENLQNEYNNLGASVPDPDFGAEDARATETLEQIIASVYWQLEFTGLNGRTMVEVVNTEQHQTFYGRWYAHLGYSDDRCKRLAKQLWYWRDRIVDAATHRYEVCNYNLDIGNNSMFLMDTFRDECSEERKPPYAIQALDSALLATNDFLNNSININYNSTAGRCYSTATRPKELWIRWNAEPIAFPAFDVWWNNDKMAERWFDQDEKDASPLGDSGKYEEFGQIKYKNTVTNDAISDVIENFIGQYILDGTKKYCDKGNKAPIFYSFQQNADVLVLSAWNKSSDGTLLSTLDRTERCPLHILCREEQDDEGEYQLQRFLSDRATIDEIGKTVESSHLSAPYIFPADGSSIIIPSYRISTPRQSDAPNIDDKTNPENTTVLDGQTVYIKLDELVCQTLVGANYETTNQLLEYDERPVLINKDNLFADTVLIANDTNVLFSFNGKKLGFSFLGNLTTSAKDIVSTTLATGCTRYLADSEPVEKIALLRKRFYEIKGEEDPEVGRKVGNYADLRIADGDKAEDEFIWNSFDRNDKFLCVVQYEKDLDIGSWRLQPKGDMTLFSSRLLNLTSDASYIPEFAYQSPKDFARFPEVSGMNKLHQATYFNQRDHWAIQLLGLENNLMLDFVKVAQDLIVRDETDNVDTYVNPGQVVDAIYRIWEQSDLTNENLGIERLHNPKLRFDENGMAVWTETWLLNDAGKESFLNRYLSIVRCNENKYGEILNEKNWVVKTTRICDLLEDLQKQDDQGNGFTRATLDDYHSEALRNGGHSISSTSHILVGTQDPYKYSTDPDWAVTLRSPAYLLQYGNGIGGTRRIEYGVFIEKRKEDEVLPEGDYPTREDAPYKVTIEVRFFKEDKEVRDRASEEMNAYIDSVDLVPARCLLMAISEDEVDHLADYHMLVHHDDIFYNIPHPDEDDVLRTEFDPRIDEEDNPPPHIPPKSFLDYLYIYEGSAAFKINEQSDKFCTFDWERPTPELDKLLYNFRKNQVDLNCLYPWSTYVTQERNPLNHINEVSLETIVGTDCKGVEEFDTSIPDAGNLILDCTGFGDPVFSTDKTETSDIINELVEAGYSLHSWENEDIFNGGKITTIDVSNEDFDPIYRIYANYQKVPDDSERGHHFDLFFNIQNLFKPPFEYMSKVTGQPAVLIPKDSYLYLDGSEESLRSGKGGMLTLYAQMKWLVNDLTSSVKLIPLVTYEIHNISDDKPKFFIRRASEMLEARPKPPPITLYFEDVYVDGEGKIDPTTGELTEDIPVVQALSVHYNNDVSSQFNQLRNLAFTIIQNTVISEHVPYIDLKKTANFLDIEFSEGKERYYPKRYNDNYTWMGNEHSSYRVKYTYQDEGYTNEDLYLCWTLPKGANVVELLQKIGCAVEDTAVKCKATMKSGDDADVRVRKGHIYINALTGKWKYLGVEHGKHLNKYGYVLTKVSSHANDYLKILLGKK